MRLVHEILLDDTIIDATWLEDAQLRKRYTYMLLL
jgi:hypothetical protein